MEKILIIEDEESILMGLEDDLTLEGFKVTGEKDGSAGLAAAKKKDFDLIVLDIMLPGMNGFEILKQLRLAGVGTPVLILTAKGKEIDKLLGLELGADDYVTKPFSPRELLARIKAILRRVGHTQEGAECSRFGDVEINFRRYEVRKQGRPVYLTSLEFALLRFFIVNEKTVLSRDSILDEVWGKDVYVNNRTVDTHVAHLRKKLEEDPSNPRYITGIRNVGYKFEP